jgi:sugar phosphate isomerase/epimerase
VCGLASSVRFDSLEPAEREAQFETGVGYLNLAAELGASFVRVFGDVLPSPESGEREATITSIAEGLDRLGERAAPLGVDVLIETHGDFMHSDLLRQVLDQVTSPRVGVVWDTHHPWRFHGEPVAETFARLAPWIRHTHWKDSVPLVERALTEAEIAAEEQARRLMAGHHPASYVPFGEGEFPTRECLNLLHSAGYHGWFSYEWEKAWHPEIAPPEVALPPFPEALRRAGGVSPLKDEPTHRRPSGA